MPAAKTLFGKVWDDHVIVTSPQGEDLLYTDFNYINEGQSFLAFDQLRLEGRTSARPEQHLAVTDHYLPTINRQAGIEGIANPEIRNVVSMMANNAAEFGLPHIHMHHARQGIAHVIGPELGISQPGMLITCNDSHTATHGAMGACAIPIGGSNQLRHVVATQTVWMKRPKTMRICIDGTMARMVTAKDIILSIIRQIGIGGGAGYAVEYAGSTIAAMSMEGRMTVCNMSVEGGAKSGFIAPDEKAYEYLKDRPRTPKGKAWDEAMHYWETLRSDDGAHFDREIRLDAAMLPPLVTWGTSPEQVISISGRVPRLEDIVDANKREAAERSLAYMGLQGGEKIAEIAIDRVFIGSCTNGRIEDLRAAARVVDGKKVSANVGAMIVPGSGLVKEQAEAEGLDKIFIKAGFEWREPGCSMCLAMNPDKLAPGQRCASTSNRNFEGRQGYKGRTHLVSPAMAAAAAIAGHFVDVREWH